MLKSNEFESQRALFYTKTKIPISQNSEIIPNSFKLTSILDKNDHQQNIKTKQKLFHIEKIKFTSSPPPLYPHPLTTTNHSTKKKKKTLHHRRHHQPTTNHTHPKPNHKPTTQNQITNPPNQSTHTHKPQPPQSTHTHDHKTTQGCRNPPTTQI